MCVYVGIWPCVFLCVSEGTEAYVFVRASHLNAPLGGRVSSVAILRMTHSPASEFSYAPSLGDETHLQYYADPPFFCVCMLPGYESLSSAAPITSTGAQAATTNEGEAFPDSFEPIRGSPALRSIMSPRHYLTRFSAIRLVKLRWFPSRSVLRTPPLARPFSILDLHKCKCLT